MECTAAFGTHATFDQHAQYPNSLLVPLVGGDGGSKEGTLEYDLGLAALCAAQRDMERQQMRFLWLGHPGAWCLVPLDHQPPPLLGVAPLPCQGVLQPVIPLLRNRNKTVMMFKKCTKLHSQPLIYQ